MKSNITKTVEQVGKLNFTGNIIHEEWYNTIKKKTARGEKAYLEAIVLLADIVYWYRPTYNRDEITGKVISITKKFRADKLQRSYESIAEKLGLTYKTARAACIFLRDEVKVIDLEFRSVKYDGGTLSNVMFIGLNVTELEKISFQKEKGFSELGKGVAQLGKGIAQLGRTYTETTAENTQENTNNTISNSKNLISDLVLSWEKSDNKQDVEQQLSAILSNTIESQTLLFYNKSRQIRDETGITEQELNTLVTDWCNKKALEIERFNDNKHVLQTFFYDLRNLIKKQAS